MAVITGGNCGIGYATAKTLIEKGATVIITGRRKEAIEKAASTLHASRVVADQSNLSDIDMLVSEVRAQFGKVDILSRLGNANEVADLITYLSGNESTFITGANFLIDGGQSI